MKTQASWQSYQIQWENKSYKVGKLLSDNEKLKLAGADYVVYGVQLAPANVGGFQVCGSASPQCIQACIFSSGRGQMSSVQWGRLKRKLLFFQDRKAFLSNLVIEIATKLKSATKKGYKLAIRLNVFSDIIWEKVFPELFSMFPNVTFYDYSKHKFRFKEGYTLPSNYHLTYSRSENTSDEFIADLIQRGINVAIPFDCKKHELPNNYMGYRVIDGDLHDSRFMDDRGVIVGLSVKGDGKKQEANANSFVVNPNANVTPNVTPSNERRFLVNLI